MLFGGIGLVTIGLAVTSILAYKSVTKAANTTHLKAFQCWSCFSAVLLLCGMIAAMVIGVPVVSCSCDDSCVDASYELFDTIRKEINASTTYYNTQLQYQQWQTKAFNATYNSASNLAGRVSDQLQTSLAGLDPSEPGSAPPAPPAAPAAIPPPPPQPQGPAPIRKPKGPDGADVVPPSPPSSLLQRFLRRHARFMSGEDIDIKPADTESVKPPSTVDEQGYPLEDNGDDFHQGHHHHICKKAAALRWMAPRISSFMRRAIGHMYAMRAAHHQQHHAAAMAMAGHPGMMLDEDEEPRNPPHHPQMMVVTGFHVPQQDEQPEEQAPEDPTEQPQQQVMVYRHHPSPMGPFSVLRGILHAMMSSHEPRFDLPHQGLEEQEQGMGLPEGASPRRDEVDGQEREQHPQHAWRVHRLPGMNTRRMRLLLEESTGSGGEVVAKPPSVWFASSSSSHSDADAAAPGSRFADKSKHDDEDRKRSGGKKHDKRPVGGKYGRDEELSQTKQKAYYGGGKYEDDDNDGSDNAKHITNEILEDAPTDEALLVRLVNAFSRHSSTTFTRQDFDKLAAKVCGSGALVLTLGSVLISCFFAFLVAVSSAAKKLRLHPWFIAQDQLRRSMRFAARHGGVVPVATPVGPAPAFPGAGSTPSDSLFRFVPGVGFVQVDAQGNPVPGAAPVNPGSNAGATLPASNTGASPRTGGAWSPAPGGPVTMLRHLGNGAVSTLRTGAEMFGTLFRPNANRSQYVPVGTAVGDDADDGSTSVVATATAPNGATVEMTSFSHPGNNHNGGASHAVNYSAGGHANQYATGNVAVVAGYPQPMAPQAAPQGHAVVMMYPQANAPAFIQQAPSAANQAPAPGSAASYYTYAERR